MIRLLFLCLIMFGNSGSLYDPPFSLKRTAKFRHERLTRSRVVVPDIRYYVADGFSAKHARDGYALPAHSARDVAGWVRGGALAGPDGRPVGLFGADGPRPRYGRTRPAWGAGLYRVYARFILRSSSPRSTGGS